MLWLWITLLSSARGAGFLGVDLVPFGRKDLVAIADGETSGTGLSEFDGVLQPPLTAWGGWRRDYTAWLFGLSVGWTRTVTYSGEQRTLSSRGGLRPSIDQRLYLRDTAEGGVLPWVQWGGYGIIPWAREQSTAWTAEEQEAFDAVADADRSRIGGYGLRVGAGVEIEVIDNLFLGARATLIFHQGFEQTGVNLVVSTQLRPETSLIVAWQL